MPNDVVPVREGSNRRSFRLKIEILEAAADRGVIPEELQAIATLKDLAAWKDEERELTPWTSNNVHSKGGHNPGLHQRWLDVRKRIELMLAKKRSGKTHTESKRQETILRSENKVLMIQNAALLASEEELHKRLRQAQRDLEGANNRLTKAGLKPVQSTSGTWLA